MSIEVKNLQRRFGATVACDHIDLAVPTGELVALLGPSGCGKTTLLRIMAGLEAPDAGSVLLHGQDATHTEVRDRGVAFVFQHYALFGHLSIFENVAFGLRVRPKATRPDGAAIARKVSELLDEPFGALDAKVRKELRRWLRRLQDEVHVTTVFVTHDQEEAMEVADRVVLMNQGSHRAAGRTRRGL